MFVWYRAFAPKARAAVYNKVKVCDEVCLKGHYKEIAIQAGPLWALQATVEKEVCDC